MQREFAVPHPGLHSRLRLIATAALCATLTVFTAGSSAAAQGTTYPGEDSFLTWLADDALASGRMAMVRDPATARGLYLTAFLAGFTNPAGSITGNPNSPSVVGMTEGRAYRRDHPDAVATVLQQYGYEPIDVSGSWQTAYELNRFRPDGIRIRTTSELQIACWEFDVVRSPEMVEAFARIIGKQDLKKVSTYRLRVTGFLGPLVPAREIGKGSCVRKIFAIGIQALR